MTTQELNKEARELAQKLVNTEIDRLELVEQQKELKSQIEMIDSKIDKLIYQLYGLSKEEIKTIENSVK